MRAAVQRNDASFVDYLHRNHDVSRTLQNLIVAIRTRAKITAQSWHSECNATQRIAEILGASWKALPGVSRSLSLPRLRCQSRNLSIQRIHNQRRSVIELSLDHFEGAAYGDVWVLVLFGIGESGEESIVPGGIVAVSLLEEAFRS